MAAHPTVTACELSERTLAGCNATGYNIGTGERSAGLPIAAQTMAFPLLSVGTFGTHIISGPRGWSFVGDSPVDLENIIYTTEAEGIAAFVSWFKDQGVNFQREHVANLRNDVFAAVLTA